MRNIEKLALDTSASKAISDEDKIRAGAQTFYTSHYGDAGRLVLAPGASLAGFLPSLTAGEKLFNSANQKLGKHNRYMPNSVGTAVVLGSGLVGAAVPNVLLGKAYKNVAESKLKNGTAVIPDDVKDVYYTPKERKEILKSAADKSSIDMSGLNSKDKKKLISSAKYQDTTANVPSNVLGVAAGVAGGVEGILASDMAVKALNGRSRKKALLEADKEYQGKLDFINKPSYRTLIDLKDSGNVVHNVDDFMVALDRSKLELAHADKLLDITRGKHPGGIIPDSPKGKAIKAAVIGGTTIGAGLGTKLTTKALLEKRMENGDLYLGSPSRSYINPKDRKEILKSASDNVSKEDKMRAEVQQRYVSNYGGFGRLALTPAAAVAGFLPGLAVGGNIVKSTNRKLDNYARGFAGDNIDNLANPGGRVIAELDSSGNVKHVKKLSKRTAKNIQELGRMSHVPNKVSSAIVMGSAMAGSAIPSVLVNKAFENVAESKLENGTARVANKYKDIYYTPKERKDIVKNYHPYKKSSDQ